jgi:hypothetical protein
MKKEDLHARLFHLKNGIVKYLYIMKKTIKSSVKKYATGGTKKETYKEVTNYRVTPPPKFANKQVTKKDGKTIVTYDTRTRTTLGELFGVRYPATVRKVYDSKGKLISGTKTTKGSYGSSSTEKIKDPKKKTTTTKKETKPTTTKSTVTKSTVTKPAVTKTTETKPKTTLTTSKTTTPAKTISQLWTEKTGTSWAEAKKQGMSDGSAASNMALMKKLQSGNPMEYTTAYKGPDYSGDAAMEAAYGEPKNQMKRGGTVKRKMKSKKK